LRPGLQTTTFASVIFMVVNPTMFAGRAAE